MLTALFYTIPYPIKFMQRNKDGVKVDENGNEITHPRWSKYVDTRNRKEVPVLGAIAKNDFIGIDIDNNDLFNEFMTLVLPHLPSNAYITTSLPLEANKGGHLLVKYSKELYDILKPMRAILKNNYSIDIQMDNALIYLATEGNRTKQLMAIENGKLVPITATEWLTTIDHKDPLPELPKVGLMFLQSLVSDYLIKNPIKIRVKSKVGLEVDEEVYNVEFLGLYLEQLNYTDILNYEAVRKKAMLGAILQKLTPKKNFPDIEEIEQLDGIATQWLLEVRRKLACDPSISEDLFHDTIKFIHYARNTTRMTLEKVESDIERDLQSDFWVYDPDWKDKGLLLTDKYNNIYEVLFCLNDASYILFNRTDSSSTRYPSYQAIADVMLSLNGFKATRGSVLRKAESVTLLNDPKLPPFFSIKKDKAKGNNAPVFNMFQPSEGLRIVRDPKLLTKYTKPILILDFLKSLIPDDMLRNMLLGYIKHKILTLDYSALYFVLSGVGGAGKGIFVNTILSYVFGEDRIVGVEYQDLVNKFNAPLEGKFILELDEPNGLTYIETEKMIAKLKKLTGAEHYSIEQKGRDPFKVPNYITPIITTNNRDRFHTGDASNDRRTVIIVTPNKLKEMFPYRYRGNDITDTTTFVYALTEELPSFARYLGETNFNFDIKAYNDNELWQNDDYKEYIETTSTDYDKIITAFANNDLKGLVDTLDADSVQLDSLCNVIKGKTRVIVSAPPKIEETSVLTLDKLLVDMKLKPMKKMLNQYCTIKAVKIEGASIKCTFMEFSDIYKSETMDEEVPTEGIDF